jgi:hypothetical protein
MAILYLNIVKYLGYNFFIIHCLKCSLNVVFFGAFKSTFLDKNFTEI